jgi:hypothetical protein
MDDLTPLLDSIRATALSQWVTGSAWIWPSLETLHFTGLAILIGGLVVMDLRVIGYKCGLPLRTIHQIMPLVFIGFGINACTGFLFVMGNPHRYAVNYAFQVKMVLLALAGLNALWFRVKISPQMAHWTEATPSPPTVKLIGAASLVLWFSVGIHGRLITFFG